MASDYGNGNGRVRGDQQQQQQHPVDYAAPGPDAFYPNEARHMQNGGRMTPDSGHRLRPTNSGSSAATGPPGAWDSDSRKSAERNRSRQRNGGRSASGQTRTCNKCGEALTGQFVRAMEGTFHLDCFKCRVCFPLTFPSPSSHPHFHISMSPPSASMMT
jgi:hypothetical protein